LSLACSSAAGPLSRSDSWPIAAGRTLMVLDGLGVEDGHGVGDELAICVRAAL